VVSAGQLLGQASAPAHPWDQMAHSLRPGCHESPAPFWPRTPLREGWGPSEHFIFPVMPAMKNNTPTYLTRQEKAGTSPQPPPQQHPLLTFLPPAPASCPPSPVLAGGERVSARAHPSSPAVGSPCSRLGSQGAGGLYSQLMRLEWGLLGWCGSRQEVMLSPFRASSRLCHPGDLCADPIFICVFSLSLFLSFSLAFFSPPPVSMWADHCSNF